MQKNVYTLCQLLLPEDPSLEEEVRYFVKERPSLQSIQRDLAVPDDHPRYPWFALIEVLYKRRLMFDLCSRHLDKYPKKYTPKPGNQKQNSFILRETEILYNSIETFLTLIGLHLLQFGFVIAEFLISKDHSGITIIPQNSSGACVSLAKQSGLGEIILYPNLSTNEYVKICMYD